MPGKATSSCKIPKDTQDTILRCLRCGGESRDGEFAFMLGAPCLVCGGTLALGKRLFGRSHASDISPAPALRDTAVPQGPAAAGHCRRQRSPAVCSQLPLVTAGPQLLRDPSQGALRFPSFLIYPAWMQLCCYRSAVCQEHLFSYLCGNTMSRHPHFDLVATGAAVRSQENPCLYRWYLLIV